MATTSSSVGLLEACEDRRLLGVKLYPRQRELLQLVEEQPDDDRARGQAGREDLQRRLLPRAQPAPPSRPRRDRRRPDPLGCLDRELSRAGGPAPRLRQDASWSARRFCARNSSRPETTGSPSRATGCSSLLPARTGSFAACRRRRSCSMRRATSSAKSWGPRTLERIWQAARPLLTIYGEAGRTFGISDARRRRRLLRAAVHAGAGRRAAGRGRLPCFDAGAEPGRLRCLPRAGAAAPRRGRFPARVPGRVLAGRRRSLPRGGRGGRRDRPLPRAAPRAGNRLADRARCGLLVAIPRPPSWSAAIPRIGSGFVVAHAERWLPKRSRKQRRRAKTEQERLDVAANVLDGVARLSKRFGHCPVVTDQHARMLVESGLKERGVPRVIHRTWSSSSQTEAFRLLRARIYGDTISLPIHDQLQRELCRVRERARSGQSAIELPRSVDGHCDLAAALGLAVWELESRPVGRARTWSSFRNAPRGLIGMERQAALDRRLSEGGTGVLDGRWL